jgi:hypothetical protein
MAMPTDEPQAAPAPSARNKAPDPHADTPKIHGDHRQAERAVEKMAGFILWVANWQIAARIAAPEQSCADWPA